MDLLAQEIGARGGGRIARLVDADGTIRLGPWADLVRDSGRQPKVLRRQAEWVEIWAAPLSAGDLVTIDGSQRACGHVLTDAAAGRYRSHVRLLPAP